MCIASDAPAVRARAARRSALVSGREYGRLQQVFRFTKNQFPRVKVPKVDELEQKHANRLVESVRGALESEVQAAR